MNFQLWWEVEQTRILIGIIVFLVIFAIAFIVKKASKILSKKGD